MEKFNEELFNELLDEFVEKEVKPLAKEIDEEERFPMETVEKLAKLNFMGIIVPKEFGGVNGDYNMYITAVRKLSRACATTGVILSGHTSLCVSPILEFGTEEQIKKYIPKLAKGEALGAFALTEPNAGTDAANQQTMAIDMGDYFLLNGNKIFITNAGYADVYIVFALTDRALGLKSMTGFIVEKGYEGFSVGKKEEKMGIRGSSTCELIFKDVKVPKENLLGKVGEGFKIAMKTLDGGRIGIAAQALGIAEGAFEETVKYVKSRKQFNKPIAKFQNTQFTLADMKTRIEASRLLVYQAAEAKMNKLKDLSLYAAMAKLYAAETASYVTNRAVQLFGGYGYTREYPVERMMRDAKITEIYEGTSEVQRMVISGSVLK